MRTWAISAFLSCSLSLHIPEMDRPDSQSRGAVVSNENEVLGGTK